MATVNSFGTRTRSRSAAAPYQIYSLPALQAAGFPEVARLPYSLKILLENLLRREDGRVREGRRHRGAGARGTSKSTAQKEISFMPARVLLQDFTGVPCVVDLAAMRDGIVAPRRRSRTASTRCSRSSSSSTTRCRSITSAQANAFQLNAELEFSRNRERYAFLRWGQNAFRNFRVVPPDTGIVHQVNIEYLARVVVSDDSADGHASRIPTRSSAPTRTRRW